MPPVACSGCGSAGWQMLFRSPTIPLEPWLHRPTRPPMSPMPGTWQTPPGWRGEAGVSPVAGAAWTAAARIAWGAWTAWVAARAGVEKASNATASSSTRMTQREIRRRGGATSARSCPGDPASASGEAGEIAIVRELLVLRSRGGFRRSRTGRRRACYPGVFVRWRLVRAGFPACGRVSLAVSNPGGVGVDPVLQFLRDQVDPDPPGAVIQVPENALAVAERAQHGLVLVGRRDPEQRHDVRHLGAFGRAEREHPGQAVGHLLIEQVTGVLRDQDQRGVPRPAHS